MKLHNNLLQIMLTKRTVMTTSTELLNLVEKSWLLMSTFSCSSICSINVTLECLGRVLWKCPAADPPSSKVSYSSLISYTKQDSKQVVIDRKPGKKNFKKLRYLLRIIRFWQIAHRIGKPQILASSVLKKGFNCQKVI